jgi:hypothetical protein
MAWRRCGPALAVVAVVAVLASGAGAQTEPASPNYSRSNTFGLLAAYSNDSSHMLLGVSENRKLLNFGATYSRRLFQNRTVNWMYTAEILPVALESDPVLREVTTYTLPLPGPPVASSYEPITTCHSGSGTTTFTAGGTVYSFNFTDSCSRRWTVGEGISPVGLQWNFLPRRKLQPVILGHGGYMYSTQPIPDGASGSFNFTFDFGVGLELYRTRTRSVRFDYRYHHISDHYTTAENPGIDNGLFTLTYSFGRKSGRDEPTAGRL